VLVRLWWRTNPFFLLAELALQRLPRKVEDDREDDGVRDIDREGRATRGQTDQHAREEEVEEHSNKGELDEHLFDL